MISLSFYTAVCPIKSEFPQCSQISIREYLFFKNRSKKMRISIPRILICEHCGNSDFMGQTAGAEMSGLEFLRSGLARGLFSPGFGPKPELS